MMREWFCGFHVSYLVVGWSVAVIFWTVGAVVFWDGGEVFERMMGVWVEVEGRVVEDPEVSDGDMALRLDSLRVDGVEVKGAVYVQLGTAMAVERSDVVMVAGTMSEGFGVFGGAMWRPMLRGVAKPDPPDVALGVRNWFGGLVRNFVPEPQVSLAQGYLLGQKRSLPEDFSDLLGEVGLTHIVVASGYNLSVLVGVSRKIFGRVSRFAAFFGALLLTVGFACMTGWSASMMRASIVTVLGLMAWYLGRKFHPVKLLLLVAAVTLLINPGYVMDLGWLLSFASFAGVMVVGPVLLAYFYGESKPNFVAAVLMETMAAQLCCLPIILFFSGSFSVVSVVANILILPTIPCVMALTFAVGCLAFLPFVAGVLGWVVSVILSYHFVVVEFFGGMGWAVVWMPVGMPWVFCGYVVLAAAVFFIKKRAKFRLMTADVLKLQ